MKHLQPYTTLQGGKYRIERVLGQGGFGITYMAEQISLGRRVAIKEFFIENLCDRSISESTIMRTITNGSAPIVDRYKQKFLKEARVISELHHENIINVYDVFEENGTAYYVMEYIDGGSLGSLLQQKVKLAEDEAVNYITIIASAVDYIHQRNINHFDIKPDNIMLRRDNTPVLIDFGISKRYDNAGAATTTTPVGISDGYAPIEQYSADGVASFSPQTDIYSLGATLYKLVTGQTPPSAPARSGGSSFNLPTTLSPSIRNAINTAMKINRIERTASVQQFISSLKTGKRYFNKWMWILLSFLVIVVFIGLFVWKNNSLTIGGSEAEGHVVEEKERNITADKLKRQLKITDKPVGSVLSTKTVVTLTNNSNYLLDEVVVNCIYHDLNTDLVHTKPLFFYNLKSHSSQSQKVDFSPGVAPSSDNMKILSVICQDAHIDEKTKENIANDIHKYVYFEPAIDRESNEIIVANNSGYSIDKVTIEVTYIPVWGGYFTNRGTQRTVSHSFHNIASGSKGRWTIPNPEPNNPQSYIFRTHIKNLEIISIESNSLGLH